jgi:RNA 2',3'-cyclic 3'-phosphodiesterase
MTKSPRAQAPKPDQSNLFFAAFVPQGLHAALETLQKQAHSGWRVTPSHQFHVTLAFLGEARDLPLKPLLEAGRDAAHQVPSFSAMLRGTGFFPAQTNPRVWFVRAEAPQLTALATALHQSLNLEFDQFKPHVTLARKKDKAARPPTTALNLEWTLDEFALVRSTLAQTGSKYNVLERFRLSDTSN